MWLYSGVRVIAGAVGTIPSVLDSPLLGRSLGGLDAGDASDSEEEDGATKVRGAQNARYLLRLKAFNDRIFFWYLFIISSSGLV